MTVQKRLPTPERLLYLFRDLGDESRLRILGLLGEGEHRVDEIAAHLGLTTPTVSHHLGHLRSQRLVELRREGTARFYRLVPETLDGLLREEAVAVLTSPSQPRTAPEPE